MNFPSWRQQLVRSLHLHRSKPEAKYFQVASVTQESLPKLRTMVFRGFEEDNHNLLAVSDIRSEKMLDWKHSPKTELHWYFVKSREQYRLSCNVSVIYQQNNAELAYFGHDLEKGLDLSKLYRKQWQALSNGAQAGFFCPAPKSALDIDTMASASENNVDYESKISP